jgi:glucosamine--fructose-6-phosphate aminotransferase (isomerizing)
MHPSALYETVHREPEYLREMLGRPTAPFEAAASILRGAKRILVTGTGTSYHAALVGVGLLRAAGRESWALTHQEMALYPPPLSLGDAIITISHRGNKRYGLETLRRAKEAGLPVVGITGKDSPLTGPEVVLPTVPQERSSTHSASYLGSLMALGLLARSLAEGSASFEPVARALPGLPAQIEGVLAREKEIDPVAGVLSERGRLVLAGAGPNTATAREGALKVKESSYLVSEGFELETLLHGGLQALARGDLAVEIAPLGAARERWADAHRALGLLGTVRWVLGDPGSQAWLASPGNGGAPEFAFELPALPEPLTPLLYVVPLQLLACFTAERRGTDPDTFREDDPVFARISASYHL